MLYNFVIAIGIIVACWLWGCGILKLVNCEEKLKLFEVNIGYALMIIVLNLLYFRLDLSFAIIKIIVIAISLVCLVYLLKKGINKSSFLSFLFVLIFFLLSATLAFISYQRGHGESFWVFRDNVDDNYNYINMGYTMIKHRFSYYKSMSLDALYYENDLLGGVRSCLLRIDRQYVYPLH